MMCQKRKHTSTQFMKTLLILLMCQKRKVIATRSVKTTFLIVNCVKVQSNTNAENVICLFVIFDVVFRMQDYLLYTVPMLDFEPEFNVGL